MPKPRTALLTLTIPLATLSPKETGDGSLYDAFGYKTVKTHFLEPIHLSTDKLPPSIAVGKIDFTLTEPNPDDA